MRNSQTRLLKRITFGAAALLVSVGCASKPDEAAVVSGKVSVKNDPLHVQRLEGGKVRLQSTTNPGVQAVGVIDHDGSFSATVLNSQESLPPGEYRVAVIPPPGEAGKPLPGVVQAKYQEFGSSPLAITVPTAAEGIELVVERPRR